MSKRIAFVALLAAALPAWAQQPPARVVAAPVVLQEVQAGQTFVGTVMPLRTSTLGSAVPGRVEDFLVNEGDRVKKGQPVARLRTKIIEAELASARATMAVHKAELDELANGYLPDEIAQARARLAAAEASVVMRRGRRQRVIDLRQTRGASAEEVEEAVAFADQAEAQVREAKAALKLLEDGPRKEKIAQAQARYESARAEMQRIEEQLDRHTIFAPFDGYVVTEHTEVGAWVNQGAPVVDVIELDKVDIEVPVLEDYVGYLREKTPARVEIGALPAEAFTGEVALIVPRGHMRARTFPVKVRVENRPLPGSTTMLLKAGMFARVTLPVGKKEKALLVPKDALVLGGPRPMVYVIDSADGKSGKALPVPVDLGVADGSWIQVKGDLKPGQLVVSEGNERLFPGREVTVIGLQQKEKR